MTYKEEFIEFLVKCNALKFGEFELKSGRIAPYFINTGMFDTGSKIKILGTYYARAIQEHFGREFDGIYGPAYKGIPLCISASMALADLGLDKGYIFNRKEAKTYADKSAVVGMELTSDTRLILVDDVITSGKAIRESLEILKTCDNPRVKGIVISVNRQEKGKTDQNALKEVADILFYYPDFYYPDFYYPDFYYPDFYYPDFYYQVFNIQFSTFNVSILFHYW